MIKKRTFFAFILTLLLLISNVMTAWAMPPLPRSVNGTVQVNGANVAAGTVVSAWINGVRYAYDTVLFDAGTSVYRLDVPGDDDETEDVIEGGVSNDTIVFHIGEIVADQTTTWKAGKPIVVDLTATYNYPPEITQGASTAVTMSEDGDPIPFGVTLGATDPNAGDTLTWSLASGGGASHGTATVSGTGAAPSVSYTPTFNYAGSDSFTVQVSDGHGGTDTILVNVTISAVNDPPTATAQTVVVTEDVAKAITLAGTDIDSATLTYAVVSQPARGTLSGTAPSLTYTPNADNTAADSFTFTVSDGSLTSPAATVTLNFTAVNDAPVITQGASTGVTMSEDSFPTAFSLTLNASDVDTASGSLTWSIPSGGGASHGTASASGTGASKAISYTPNANYTGSDSFTVQVSDGSAADTILVNVTIDPVNDAPVAIAQTVVVTEDTAKAITLAGTDIDSTTLTYVVVSQPARGTLSGTAPNLTYTPNANNTTADSFTFTVSDGSLTSPAATVTLNFTAVNDPPTANAQTVAVTEDTLTAITLTGSDIDGDPLTFSIVTGPTHGALAGSGASRTYTPGTNWSGSDSFTFKVNDTKTDSNTATVTINVSAVNDAPVATAQSVTTDEGIPVPITLAGSDVEGDPLTFSVVGSPAHGTLSGAPPNLTYTPASGYSGPDTFTFKVNDGKVDSATATVSITVNPVNFAPVADAQSVTTSEDTAKAITLTGSDADSDPLTFAIVTDPSHGTLSGSGASRTYTPAANYSGTDSFTFKVNDGTVDSDPAAVSINVTAVNDAPVAAAQTVVVTEDTAKAITLAGTDIDSASLTYAVVSQPAHGTLSGTAPNLTYTPNADNTAADSFTFTVSDGPLTSAAATVTLNFTAVNDAPVITQGASTGVTMSEDGSPTAFSLTLNASDVDTASGSLTWSIAGGGASHGTASASGTGASKAISYAPNANYSGSDSFTVQVSDGSVADTITVNVTIDPVNDAPVAAAQTVVVTEDTAKAITLAGSDIDSASLTYAVVSQPAHGTLSGTAPNLTYTPNADNTAADSFTFTVSDGPLTSAAATVTLNFTAVNDAPVITQGASTGVTMSEDGSPTAFSLTLNASDVDTASGSLTWSIASGGGASHGTASASGTGASKAISYAPNANYSGSDSFTVQVSDGSVADTITVNVTIDPVNDAPVAAARSVTVVEDTPTAITLAGTDVDGDALTFSVVDSPAHGDLTGTAPNLTYTPDSGYNGADSFTFTVRDSSLTSAAATVSITVSEVNNQPEANAQSVTTAEDTAKVITLTGTDAEGDTLTFTVLSGPQHGTLSGDAPALTYTPAADFNGADSFTFKVNDGALDSAPATVSITVEPVNDAPVAAAQSLSTNEDTALDILLAGSDVDGDELTFSIMDEPQHGTLSGAAPALTYTPAKGYSGADSFTFTVSDGELTSIAAPISITVSGTNTAPVAADQPVNTAEDTAAAITLAGTDVDGDTLAYTVVSGPAHGALSGTAPALTYTPAADFNGADSFTFKVNDGALDSNVATVSITVTPVNDAPVAAAQSVETAENTAVAITLAGSDVEGSSLTYTVVSQPQHGALSGTAPALTYTPAAGYSGPDSFTFKVNDGALDSAPAAVSITVTPANEAPVAVADAYAMDQDKTLTVNPAAGVLANDSDPDGDSLTAALVDPPASGALTLNADGSFTYTPATGFTGTITFTYQAFDGSLNSQKVEVKIVVTGIPVTGPTTLFLPVVRTAEQ